MTPLTAYATRTEGWWAVSVPDVDGLYTQTRRLDQVPDMVRDALRLFPELDIDPEQADIAVIPTGELGSVADETRTLRLAAEKARTEASNAMRTSALALKEDGLSYRDIGTLLGISHQRAQQLASGNNPTAA